MSRSSAAAFVSVVSLFAFSSPAQAQTLVTLEGTFPSGGEFSIDPPNPCGYPNQNAFVWFLTDFASTCGTINTFTPPPTGLLGDSAIDKVNDVTWMTDGLHLAGYQNGASVANVPLVAFTLLGGPITGLGFDSENGLLWLTDGLAAVAITPPAPGCPPVPTAAAVGPITLPIAGTAALDLDWDSWTDTLWVCDDVGVVTNVTTTGLVGPGGQFAPTLCSAAPWFTGIAFDSATGNLFLTDGVQMIYITPTGTAAPPTFYAPGSPCMTPPPPGPPAQLSGLSFSPRPQRYGVACTVTGVNPTIGFTGSFSTSPNPNFGITLSTAHPNAGAVLLLSTDAPCPGFVWGACEIVVNPFLLLPTVTDANGSAAMPLPIPAFPPASIFVGLTIKSQWLVLPGPGGRQATEGLSFTLSTL